MKRVFDIFGGILGLLVIAPFVPFIVMAIKFESKGPIIVRLKRMSRGKIVEVYKFRSMIHGAEAIKTNLTHLNERRDGPFFKIKNDPRLTKSGKIIRKFRIDEFPQLVNVLKGDLSLVGPRPHEEQEIEKYPDEFKSLKYAKAGVTGLSQVNGASSLPFIKELQLDSYYLKNQNLWLDLKIIGKTLRILFSDPTAV